MFTRPLRSLLGAALCALPAATLAPPAWAQQKGAWGTPPKARGRRDPQGVLGSPGCLGPGMVGWSQGVPGTPRGSLRLPWAPSETSGEGKINRVH